jgi:quercetin dioxygenase-like cupin family protein
MTANPIDPSHVRVSSEGNLLDLGFAEIRIVLRGSDTDGAFAVSQQSLQPKALAGPLHTHANEAGFIYVLEGVIGAQLNGDVVRAEVGSTIFVEKNAVHTFWNETEKRAEVLELFTPAGLEAWFSELAEIVASAEFDMEAIVESGRRFGTELDLESIDVLLKSHDLVFPMGQ